MWRDGGVLFKANVVSSNVGILVLKNQSKAQIFYFGPTNLYVFHLSLLFSIYFFCLRVQCLSPIYKINWDKRNKQL